MQVRADAGEKKRRGTAECCTEWSEAAPPPATAPGVALDCEAMTSWCCKCTRHVRHKPAVCCADTKPEPMALPPLCKVHHLLAQSMLGSGTLTDALGEARPVPVRTSHSSKLQLLVCG